VPDRHLPVRPNLDPLRHQANEASSQHNCARCGQAGRRATRAGWQLRFVNDESWHEDRDVTPLGWGQCFHDQSFVSQPALRLIAARGGRL
jgi:hypothetical protein